MSEDINPCPRCGALPCDWVDNPHSTPAPADASGWHSGMFTEEWLALPPDRKIDTMFEHGLLGYGELEPHFKIICEQIRALSTPPRPIDMGEIERALEALVNKLDEVSPFISQQTEFMLIHGHKYTGPNYGEELKAARQALAAIKGEGKNHE